VQLLVSFDTRALQLKFVALTLNGQRQQNAHRL